VGDDRMSTAEPADDSLSVAPVLYKGISVLGQ
jgi:hypothetical protein